MKTETQITKKKMERQIVLYKKVTGGSSGHIGLPKFLIGKEVKVVFTSKLTEEERKKLELNKIMTELREMREKRKAK